MFFNEAISKRIYELCDKENITIYRLAELSIIPPFNIKRYYSLSGTKS